MDLARADNIEVLIAAGGANQLGARGHQRSQIREVPSVGVDPPHAITSPVHGAVGDVRGNRGGSGSAWRRLSRAHPPRGCTNCKPPPPDIPVVSDALRVDFRTSHQQIDAANAIQHFDSTRRVIPAVPVETTLAAFSLMAAFYFPAQYRLDEQAHETQLGEFSAREFGKGFDSLRDRRCKESPEPCPSGPAGT